MRIVADVDPSRVAYAYSKARQGMKFVVQGLSERPGEETFVAEKATAKDAIETAIGLIGQGLAGVTIITDTGRIYNPSEFGELFLEEARNAAKP